MKNKTVAAWLALFGGPLGLHRFYLLGMRDLLGWALNIPTLLGIYGLWRAQLRGLDDQWSWLLIPPLGFTFAGCALTTIVYGLMSPQKWNARFNATSVPFDHSGSTHWLTICAVIMALLLGTISLTASLVLSFQRAFEYQALSVVMGRVYTEVPRPTGRDSLVIQALG
jgi:hypothetical protein